MPEIFTTPFKVEEVERLRNLYNEGEESVAFDLANVVGDEETAQMILEGPDSELVALLKERPDDQEVAQHFDNVFGRGAAEFYRNQPTDLEKAVDTVTETVKQGAQAVTSGLQKVTEGFASGASKVQYVRNETQGALVHGVAGAAAETIEFAANAAEDVEEAILGDEAKQHARRLESLREDLARKKKFFKPDHPMAAMHLQTQELLEQQIAELEAKGAKPKKRLDLDSTTIVPDEIIPKPETLAGKMGEGVVQFLAGFAIPAGTLGKLRWVAKGGAKAKAAAALVAGFMSDFTAFDPDDPTISQTLSENFDIPENVVVDYLTKTDEDGEYEKRFKSALEGAGIGVATEMVFITLRAAMRAKTGVRTVEEAEAEVIAAVESVPVKPIDEAAISNEEVAERIATQPEVTRRHEEVQTKADEVSKDSDPEVPGRYKTSNPIRPTVPENIRNVKRASAFVKQHNDRYREALKEAEDEILKPDGNLVDDELLRSNEAQAKAAKRTYSLILRHAEANGEANWQQLIAWARRSQNDAEKMVTATAFKKAADAAKVRLTGLLEDYKVAQTAFDMSPADKAALEVELDHAAQVYFGLRSIDQDIGSNAGRLLQARKSTVDMDDVKAPNDSRKPNKKSLEKAGEDAKGFTEKLTKAEAAEKAEYDRLRKLGVKPSDAIELVELRNRELRTAPPKHSGPDHKDRNVYQYLFDWTQAVRYGSMLSGTATHAINIGSSLVHGTSWMVSELVRPSMTRFALDRLGGMSHAIGQSANYAWKAAREMEPRLAKVSQMDFEYDPVTKNIAVTLFPRIMMGTDELFRQMWYRGEIAAKAAKEGRLAGLEGDDLVKHINERVEASLDDGRALDRAAEGNAAALTFQRNFDKNSKYQGERAMANIQSAIQSTWAGQIIAPFSRVSMDLLDVGVRMTPGLRRVVAQYHGGNGKSRFLDDLSGKNGEIAKSRAIGHVYQGYALTGMSLYLALQGKMTGGAPPNYREANLEKESGPPPYSIQMPNGEWVSFDRWEPFATPMKLTANLVEYMQQHQWEAENGLIDSTIQEKVGDAMLAASFAMAEMISSQPYTEGLDEMFDIFAAAGSDQIGNEAKQWGVSTVESYVPNILKKWNQARGAHEGEYVVREWDDVFTRHFSTFIPNYSGDKRRSSLTGEVTKLTYDQKAQRWFPYLSVAAKERPGIEMLQTANKFYGSEFYLKLPTAFRGLPDLRTEKAADGERSLYDKFLENIETIEAPKGSSINGMDVSGLTYSEALDLLSQHPEFVALPWLAEGVDPSKLQASASKRAWILDVKKEYQGMAEMKLEEDTEFARLLQEAKEHTDAQVEAEFNALEFLGID